MQLADWCEAVKVPSSAQFSVLQPLKFEEVGVRRMLAGGATDLIRAS
jgi:hypothetical protein